MKTAQTMALVVHELATNAVKYGALSNAKGGVTVRWSIEQDDQQAVLAFEWREYGGPPPIQPNGKGFGSVLTGQIAASQLGCSPDIAFTPTGLEYRFRAPLSVLQESGSHPA